MAAEAAQTWRHRQARLWQRAVAWAWRRWLLAVIAATLLAMLLLDRPVLHGMAALREASPAFDDWMTTATIIGDSGWMLAATALPAAYATWLMRQRRSRLLRRGLATVRDVGLTAFATVGLLGLLAALLKLVIGRPRPTLFEELGAFGFQPFAFDFKINSLPSGHATTLFALAAILVLILPRWRWPILGLAALGALTRVAVGAHYVSDVIAGGALGYAGALGLARLAARQSVAFSTELRPLAPRATRAALRGMVRQAPRDGAAALGWLRRRLDVRAEHGAG